MLNSKQSNNISAAQISADYERRRREAAQQNDQEEAASGEPPEEEELEQRQETAIEKKKRKLKEEKALAKIKNSKSFKRHKKANEDGPDGDDEDVAWDMYTKKTPIPGQLDYCELCNKRFTVTPYSKTGPDGGLLCPKCSKEQEAQKKKDQRPKKKPISRGKAHQIQSNLLDGLVSEGARSLQEICVRVSITKSVSAIMLTWLRKWRTTSMMLMSLVISHNDYTID